MLSIIKIISKCSLYIILPAVFLLPVFSGDALAQFCSVSICKSAEDSGETAFPFVAVGDVSEPFELFGEGEHSCFSVGIPLGEDIEVFEEPIPGWELDDIQCDLTGVNVTFLENGVDLDCLTPSANGDCTFFNVPAEFTTNIPTLSEWGMISAAAGLGLVGVFFAVRKRLRASEQPDARG